MKRQPEQTKEIKEADVLFLVGQVPPFIEAFRYHPIRLLRLLDSNKAMRQVFDTMQVQYKTDIWYYLCVHAFPNEMLLLESMSHVALYGEIQGYVYKECMDNYFFKLIDKKEIKMHHDRMLDRSFLSPVLRKQCLANETIARQTAEAFKILYPFGTPPAEYCFSSQMALQRLLLSYFTFLSNLPALRPRRNPSPEEIFFKFFRRIGDYTHALVTRRRFNIYEWEEFRESLSVEDCLKIIREPGAIVEATGLGPRKVINNLPRQGYRYDAFGVINQPAFTLMSLEKNISASLRNDKPIVKNGRLFKEEELVVLREMHRDVLFQVILFSKEDELDAYRDKEDFAEAIQRRQYLMEEYGTVDPLYWSLLRRGERQLIDSFDAWEPVFRKLVKEMLARVPKRPDDRADYLDMTCHHCGGTAKFIQDAAPFGMYCDDKCYNK